MTDLTESKNNLSPFHISREQLMALPGKKALDRILESPMPARLVQSLAEEDFFWLVHDIGPEDALPVLARATNDQWQYLLDIELWERDRLANGAMNRWMDLLMKADSERFITWGVSNVDLVELHLFRNLEVKIKEEADSVDDFGDDFFSLDDIFFFRITDSQNAPAIRQFLEHLAAYDLEKYHQILLEMAGLIPAETEEDLYRFRNTRLAEKGLLPFEEAIGIYQHMGPEKLLGKDFAGIKQPKSKDLHQIVPVSSALFIKDHGLFSSALKHIEDESALEQVKIEFAALCNQILSADSLVVRAKEDLAAIVRKACGYLDVALEELVAGDPTEAVSLLDRFPLNDVFRVGYGAALKLKWKADKWMAKSWFNDMGLDLDFWEEDWEGMLEGLSRKRPLLYTGFADSGEAHRDFRSLGEIRKCHEALDEIVGLDYLLSLVFSDDPPKQPDGTGQTPTYKNLLLTNWARHHLGLEEKNRPLTVEQFQGFFQDLWGQGNKPYFVEPTMKEEFIGWVTARAGIARGEMPEPVAKTLDRLFGELEKEYGTVSLGDLDPRYVRHFLVMP